MPSRTCGKSFSLISHALLLVFVMSFTESFGLFGSNIGAKKSGKGTAVIPVMERHSILRFVWNDQSMNVNLFQETIDGYRFSYENLESLKNKDILEIDCSPPPPQRSATSRIKPAKESRSRKKSLDNSEIEDKKSEDLGAKVGESEFCGTVFRVSFNSLDKFCDFNNSLYYLLEIGALQVQCSPKTSPSLMYEAARNQTPVDTSPENSIVSLLLHHDIAEPKGYTFLHFASRCNDEQVLEKCKLLNIHLDVSSFPHQSFQFVYFCIMLLMILVLILLCCLVKNAQLKRSYSIQSFDI